MYSTGPNDSRYLKSIQIPALWSHNFTPSVQFGSTSTALLLDGERPVQNMWPHGLRPWRAGCKCCVWSWSRGREQDFCPVPRVPLRIQLSSGRAAAQEGPGTRKRGSGFGGRVNVAMLPPGKQKLCRWVCKAPFSSLFKTPCFQTPPLWRSAFSSRFASLPRKLVAPSVALRCPQARRACGGAGDPRSGWSPPHHLCKKLPLAQAEAGLPLRSGLAGGEKSPSWRMCLQGCKTCLDF